MYFHRDFNLEKKKSEFFFFLMAKDAGTKTGPSSQIQIRYPYWYSYIQNNALVNNQRHDLIKQKHRFFKSTVKTFWCSKTKMYFFSRILRDKIMDDNLYKLLISINNKTLYEELICYLEMFVSVWKSPKYSSE